MSYQVFARKTRPRNFSEVVGQSHVLQALSNGLDANRVHHAFLFTGTRGVGKTTIARIFSKALNCEKGVSASPCGECAHCVDIDAGRFVDLIEIDAASRTGVDDIRELIDNVQYAPTRGRHKVYLIDEVHMLSNSAFNALLKTLEEPPEHVKFLLATTDPQKIPVTVLSRCLQFNLRRLSSAEIRDHLANVLSADGVEYEAPALSLIARAADGSVRDSLSLLDQALNFGAGKLNEAETRSMLGTVDESRVADLLSAIVACDSQKIFELIEALQSYGFDWKASLSELALMCQRIAVGQQAAAALPDDTPALDTIKQFAEQLTPADVQLYYQVAVSGLRDMDYAPEPRAGFEMTILRMVAFQPAQAVLKQPAAKPVAAATPTSAKEIDPEPTVVAEPPVQPAEPVAKPNEQAEPTVTSSAAPSTAATAEPTPEPINVQAEAEPVVVQEPAPAAAPPQVNLPATGLVDWPVFSASLPLKGMLVQLAENIAVLNQDEQQLVLGISESMGIVCPEGVRQRFIELVEQHLPGKAISVQVMADTAEASQATPAAKAAKEEVNRQIAAEESIQKDPNVQQLVNEFDGHVEDGSVKPVEL